MKKKPIRKFTNLPKEKRPVGRQKIDDPKRTSQIGIRESLRAKFVDEKAMYQAIIDFLEKY